jgi:hypothetical protein
MEHVFRQLACVNILILLALYKGFWAGSRQAGWLLNSGSLEGKKFAEF